MVIPRGKEFQVTRRAKLGAALSLIAFGLIFGLIVWPLVCAICVVGLFVGKRFIRSWVARCAHWWGSIVFFCIRVFLRLKVNPPIVQGDPSLIRGKTCIVIANHQATMDAPVDAWLIAWRLRLPNLRWVIKAGLRKAPIIGWIARIIGCAFVSRSKDPGDLAKIKQCAAVALEDGASVAVYPEGTRFHPTLATSEFTHVLCPKTAGFERLCEMLPDAPIVTITRHWSLEAADGSRGKTIFHGADYYQTSLSAIIRIVPRSEVRCPRQWLLDDFKEKNRLLSSLR